MSLLKSIAGPLIGGITGLIGGERANKESAASTAAQIAFQRESLQNAYQWRVADLKAAGLNPMLAFQQSVSGAPGASYTARNVGEDAMRGVSSAGQLAINMRQQNALLGAQKRQADAQATKTGHEARSAKEEADRQRDWAGAQMPVVIERVLRRLGITANSAKDLIRSEKTRSAYGGRETTIP